MDLEVVAHELYGLAPQDFTPARDSRSSEARDAGDRQLAAAIKRLKRPSAAAWLANSLVRHRPEQVGELLAVGNRLRDAQRRLAGDELKDLARAGHRMVAVLVGEAADIASAAGQPPGASSLRQLQETLDAALADPEAGLALKSGRLTGALSYAGLGDVEGQHASAVSGSERERAEAARSDLRAAERRAAELSAELQSAHRLRDRLREQIDDMERQLGQVRSQESGVGTRIEELETGLSEAQAAIAAASSRLASRD